MTDQPLPTTMRVPRFLGSGQIDFADKPVPVPGPGQLLVRARANALCGSERGQFYDGTAVTPGHETAGIVVASGAGTRTPVGTSGVVYLMDYCGECRSCRQGFTNQCLNKRGDMGFNRDGGYGQYELVHETIFFQIDSTLDLIETTLLLDVMSTSSHAISRAQRMRTDIESVVIAGAGPVGLGLLAMTKLILGVDVPVGISDVSPWRLRLAERLGGLPVDAREGSLVDGLRGYGLDAPDAAFDASGKTVAREALLSALTKRSVLVCVGHGEGLTVAVSQDLIAPERAVMGSEYFRYDELPANLVRLREHRAYLSQIITHRFGPDEIQPAFEVFFGGETGKVVIVQ